MIEIMSDLESPHIPSLVSIQEWAIAALEEATGDIAIRIVDQDEMCALNLQYAGKSKPTNVLSFPAVIDPTEQNWILNASNEPNQSTVESGQFPSDLTDQFDTLGDIAICAPVVEAEALEQAKSLHAHYAHMVVHGVLHLRGFDHQSEFEAEAMEACETALLVSLGFPNPYTQEVDANSSCDSSAAGLAQTVDASPTPPNVKGSGGVNYHG